MNNKQKILVTCREQMNLKGAQAIGTGQICETLGISPGNLYYHFKNKEEIVLALFLDLDRELRTTFDVNSGQGISAADFAGYYVRSLEVAYDHRYFFSGLLYLLRRDKVLAERYRDLQSWTLDQLETIVRQAASEGNLEVPNSLQRYQSIATNTWLVWSNWGRYLEISRDSHAITRSDMIMGVHQIFDVLSGYLTPEFDRGVRKHLSALAKNEQT